MTDTVEVTTQSIYQKPVTMQAIQWTGGAKAAETIIQWMWSSGTVGVWHGFKASKRSEFGVVLTPVIPEHIEFSTLRGSTHASVGDWIVENPLGDFFSVDPELFATMYKVD